MMNIQETDTSWRDLVAKEISWSRRQERLHHLHDERMAREYVECLGGIGQTLRYVQDYKQAIGSNVVLDCGAGSTRAISQIEESQYGIGLTFRATVLRFHRDISMYLGGSNTTVTTVETLRRIRDSSIACVISTYGIGYSDCLGRAVERLDQVLTPGGIVKANFIMPENFNQKTSYNFKPSTVFIDTLRQKGYDIVATSIPNSDKEVVLGVKPGGTVAASTILHRDLEDYDDQYRYFSAPRFWR